MTQARTLSLIGSALTVNTSTYDLTISNNVTIAANLTVNNSTINSLTANGTINFGTSSITNNSIFIGNSSVNTNILNSAITVSNSTSSTTIGSGYISSSNTNLVGATSIGSTLESVSVISTRIPFTGTVNIDILSQPVVLHTNSLGAQSSWTLNVRGNSNTTLNSVLAVGQSVTITHMVTQSSVPYYPTSFTIDSVSQTVKYQYGTSFTSSGDASALSAFTYTIIKTSSSPTYTVLASQTRFS